VVRISPFSTAPAIFLLWWQSYTPQLTHHIDRSPDNARIKFKMMYASSKDALRRSLVGVAAEIQGTDADDVSHGTGA